VISAAALALFACAALITLLGAATEQGRSELYAITPNQALDKLALDFLKHGATMSVQDMESKLSAWHNSPATLLDMDTHVKGLEPTQMLALGPKSILAGVRPCSFDLSIFPAQFPQISLAYFAVLGDIKRKLCSWCVLEQTGHCSAQRRTSYSASLTISSRNSVVRSYPQTSPWTKLPRSSSRQCRYFYSEVLSFIFVLRFHLHCEMTLQRDVQAWLDSESEYRLDVQKAKDALEGATFARNAYEKWETANKQEKHKT
jgi:hypothetical protein